MNFWLVLQNIQLIMMKKSWIFKNLSVVVKKIENLNNFIFRPFSPPLPLPLPNHGVAKQISCGPFRHFEHFHYTAVFIFQCCKSLKLLLYALSGDLKVRAPRHHQNPRVITASDISSAIPQPQVLWLSKTLAARKPQPQVQRGVVVEFVRSESDH